MVVPPSGGSASTLSATPVPVAQKSKGPAVNGTGGSLPLSARRAEPLNLFTVERRGQGPCNAPGPKRSRLHNIPDAPVYRPTEEEFRDPNEYMRSIAPEGRKYGIIKIIPPDSWNPDFAIDTTRFHFRVRRQELNSVEGGTRANLNYLDQLSKFHKQHGHSLTRFPSVDKRPLDLYKLKKAVGARGGFERVCKLKKWAEIGRDLGYSGKIMSSLSTSLKNSYQRWLLPYEEYLRVAKPGVQQQLELENGGPYTPSPGPSPVKRSQSQQNTPLSVHEETPAMRASAALNNTLNSAAKDESANTETPPPAVHSGFTAVNAGGFTTANGRPTSSAFTSVNGTNGHHTHGDAGHGTPVRQKDSPQYSNTSTPNFRPVNVDGLSSLKRTHSEGLESSSNGDLDSSGRKSKRIKMDGPPTVAGSNMHMRTSGPRPSGVRDPATHRPGETCETCGSADNSSTLLVCDSCDHGFHMKCLDPPVSVKPDYDWHCPRCLVGTGEFGFEEGEVYSLKAFQDKARQFKDGHFADKLPTDPITGAKRAVTEDDVEREFWRLVENITETVEVEYGADIHSTTHGSGFPTIEKQPLDPYSSDPWNLNVLPLYGESLFRHIKSDISGMTVPWLYVGMVFSTFCWHNEDHYAYSANYQHFGATKTWYGIPGEDAEKFENAMRAAVPELFETQPDLLFQLVTLMPPEKLVKAGVRVYAVDQRAGEMVITFPQAYHAGFNHGFNLNEAVNFAPTDWEPFGEAGVERLRTYRRQPCFSHDELLVTAASRDHTIKTAKWLAPALERMIEHEISARKQFLEDPAPAAKGDVDDMYRGPRYLELPDIREDDLEEDDYICSYCKAFSFLSRYVCNRTGKVMCLLHAGNYECCDATEVDRYYNHPHRNYKEDHVLIYRINNQDLQAMQNKVAEKAKVPELWAEKVNSLLDEEARPQLKSLRSLVQEGERIPYDLPQLVDLKQFVDRCNEWVEEATNYITRKQHRRKSEKPGRKSFAKIQELEEREKEYRKVDNIRKLLAEADEISFECQEIATLRERAESIAGFQRDVREAYSVYPPRSTQEYEDLVEIGKAFNVDLPEIEQLEKMLQRLKWNEQARDKRGQFQTLQEVSDFIQAGSDMGLLATDINMTYYRDLKLQGELWETKAKELMSVEHVHYQQLDALSKQAVTLPVTPETLAQVDSILKKQREAQERIVALYEQCKHPDFHQRPMYKEVRDAMAALEELNSKPAGAIDLEKEQRRHEEWMRRGKRLFGKTNAPLHILHQHMQIVQARNAGCFDLRDKPRMPVEPSSRPHTPEPKEPGDMSDGSKKPFPDVFCICRKPEAGMMIECEICHEWYHGKCLKIARGKVKEDDKYTCPICDWRLKIPRDAARPKLEDLQNWYDEVETLPFQPEEGQTLQETIDTAQAFRDYVRPWVNPLTVSPDEIGTLRFYLRKVEGADIHLPYETNFLRQELHKWAPVAPTAPPIIEHSSSTRKPRPTKQQKIMAQLGITNPDDLPPQYKIKPTIKKRVTDALAMQRAHQPLQPASGSPSLSQSGHESGMTPSARPPPAVSTPSQPHLSHHTPSFSYDSQTRPMVTQGYRDSPIFAPSSVFAQPQGQPSTAAQQPQLGVASSSPSVFDTRNTLNPAQFSSASDPPYARTSPPPPAAFSSNSNLDPELFAGTGGPSMFEKPGSAGAASPNAYGAGQNHVGLDSLFADMVHDEGTLPSSHASEAFAAGETTAADDAPLDEFINHDEEKSGGSGR